MQQVPKFGGQSMITPLKKVFLKSPNDQPEETDSWKAFGYFHKPDLKKAIREHEQFVELLREEGVEVILAQEEQRDRLDSIFVFDPAIITNKGAIICKMAGTPKNRHSYFL